MRDLLSWNLYLGRLAGVHIRMHVFFLLLAVFVIAGSHQVPLWYGFTALGILLLAVAWHEAGHCFAAHKLGSHPDQVLLWPLGGLVNSTAVHEPQQEWTTAAAGLLANLILCVAIYPILLASGAGELVSLNPVRPPWPVDGHGLSWQLALALGFWLNWVLALINLLPAFPLDGARILRAMLWPRFGYRTAVLQVARIAKITALLLVVLAWVVYENVETRFATAPLVTMALFLYFSARQEGDKLSDQDGEEGFFGYDFSQGYTSLDRTFDPVGRSKSNLFRQWLAERRAVKLRRQREIEEQEDARVDDVLARLHEHGVERLSDEDRALLERVSARYRNRQGT